MPNNPPWRPRWLPVLLAAAYIAAFGWLRGVLGPGADALGIVVVLAAASNGLAAGLAVSAVCMAVTLYYNGLVSLGSAGSVATLLALPLVGAVVGRLQDLHDRLDREVAARRRTENELRDAREAAEAANMAKSAFLARMSHEIRTPMHGVLGMAQVLAETPLNDEQRSHLDMVLSSGQLLLSVINDVLDFSKIEAGRLQLESVEFSPAAALRESFELVSAAARDKGLQMRLELDESLPARVKGDSVRLRQVAVNLLGNAVKFTHRGAVTLRGSAQPAGDGRSRLAVAVQDDGIGIDPSAMARIFEPFGQADTSTTRVYGGTGLGLAICKQLCELMGGALQCQSQLGAGSTFSFHVVLAQCAASSEPTPRTDSLPAVAGGRVLVAEDNRINQVIAARLLEGLGVRVDIVGDGELAVQAARTGHFDVVLLDCQMPKVDGYEAARQIRGLPGPAGKVPILAVTASVLPSDHAACKAAGMDEILLKPLQAEDLRGAVLRRLPRAQRPQSGVVAVPRQPETPVIDVSALADLKRAGGKEVVLTVIALFEEVAEESLAELQQAAGDLPALARLAHRQRGTAGSVGARRLAEALSQLENAAHAGQPEAAAAAVERCRDEMASALNALQRFHTGDSSAFVVPPHLRAHA